MEASVYLVLGAGSLAGGVVKGLSGFGSAIILLLVWIICTSLGVDSGPLQLAVVMDCICALFVALPLMIMASAHKTADWRLLITTTVGKLALAPVGAAMLVYMNPRIVELVMASILVLVIIMRLKVGHHMHTVMTSLMQRIRFPRVTATHGHNTSMTGGNYQLSQKDKALLPTADYSKPDSKAAQSTTHSGSGAVTVSLEGNNHHFRAANSRHTSQVQVDLRSSDQDGTETAQLISNHQDFNDNEPWQFQPGDSISQPGPANQQLHHPDVTTDATRSAPAAEQGALEDNDLSMMEEGDLKLLTGAEDSAGMVSSGQQEWASCLPTWVVIRARRAYRRVLLWSRRPNVQQNLKIIGIGSIAGSASGLMEGMTSMGGPPIMYMYDKLQVSKEVVRGTNAVSNVMQFRIIAYIMLGVFHKDQLWVYITGALVHLVGCVLGSLVLYRYVEQRAFSNLLVALMVICCVLMFASAAGLTGKNHR